MASKKPGTAIVAWDEELAKYAAETAKQEASTGTGNFFSLKGGVLSYGGNAIPGNEMNVVILDAIHKKAYYDRAYDGESGGGPVCFAYSRDGLAMSPHEKSTEKQCDTCDLCPHNLMGSAIRSDGSPGKGKACREGRRLALISAADLNAKSIPTAEIGYLETPPTSIIPYALYVKALASTAKRPPFAVVTKVKLVPDRDTQFKLQFELAAPLPQDVVKGIMERLDQTKQEIMFPYMPPKSADEARPARAAKAPAKTPAKSAAPKAPLKNVVAKAASKAPAVKPGKAKF